MPFSQIVVPHVLMAGVKLIPALMTGAALLSLISLGSCSTTPNNAANYGATGATAEGELFGDYLAGTYANYVDDAEARSEFFTNAFERDPQDRSLGRKAVTSAITAGDFDLAVRLADEVEKRGSSEAMSRAVLGIADFSQARYTQSLQKFEDETVDLTVSILMKLVQAGAQNAAGDASAARTTLSALPGGGYFNSFGFLQLAELELGLSNFEAAETALSRLKAQDGERFESEIELLEARVLSAKGDISGALENLEAYSKDNGTFEIGLVPASIAALKAGQPLQANYTPQQSAARALTESAYGFFGANRAWNVAEVFLRIAMELDPDYAKARVWLGDILAFNKRDAEALELFQSIPESSPHYVSAKISEGYLNFRQDKDDEALFVFKKLYDNHPSFVTRNALGQAYIGREDYESALPIFEALVGGLSEDELKQDPRVLFVRGVAYERTKNWQAAVADFQRVLGYKPDDADTLNYLGYTWVDRGENLTKAFEMIRKAVELEPQSGAIVDSLGWAHYKLGDYEDAKVQLEKAVSLSPSSATIIDHLGDVYYKLGRKREARYQWERALDFDPTDKEIKDINAKIKGGLYAIKAAP